MGHARTWPFSVCPPDNVATPGRHNVRKPNGIVVFSEGVDARTAQEACYALNEHWDQAVTITPQATASPARKNVQVPGKTKGQTQ